VENTSVIQMNLVGNYYKVGAGIVPEPAGILYYAGFGGQSEVQAQYVPDSRLWTSNNIVTTGIPLLHDWGGNPAFPIATSRINLPQVTTTSAEQAYTDVLAKAGAGAVGTGPGRDAVDARVVNDVKNGTGFVLNNSPSEVGGYPPLAQNTRPANFDTDRDGIPDSWELAHGLKPNDPTDGAQVTASGYTNLERYLNELAGDAAPSASLPPPTNLRIPGVTGALP
jgi:hypothetical protein